MLYYHKRQHFAVIMMQLTVIHPFYWGKVSSIVQFILFSETHFYKLLFPPINAFVHMVTFCGHLRLFFFFFFLQCVDSSARLSSVINPPVDVIASCVNCLSTLAARMPGKVPTLRPCRRVARVAALSSFCSLSFQVWSSLQRTGFLPFSSNPVSSMAQCVRCRPVSYEGLERQAGPLVSIVVFPDSAEGMKAGNYGNLLVQIEQPRGEYAVTMAFLKLVTTLVKVSRACCRQLRTNESHHE